MGRYSSDSEEEKKKRKKKKKKRSRSRSGSIESKQSTKQKKSKKKKKKKSRSRSVSRSPDRFGRDRSRERYRSRSRSRSYGRRSRSRDKYRRRSRSPSRGRYSRSRSRERRRRRSRSYDSHSRSSRRSQSPSRKGKRNRSKEREDPCLSIPGFSEMAPSEQAKIRMQMALKAAAAADEKIKGDNRSSSSTSLQDSLAFSQAIQDIESSSFSATSFKSNRGDKKGEKIDMEAFTFGTAGELRLDSNRKPVIVDVDKEELAHPSLYTDPEEKLDKWIQRLTLLRRKKLEGEALS